MGKSRKILLNFIASTSTQIITLVLGMILPRLILVSWGSEYNGLINSVSAIMRYLALLEAGVGTSTLQALYKSIGSGDNEQTSVIIRSSQRFYHVVSIFYLGAIILISFIYPMMLTTEIPYWVMFWFVFLQGCTGVINFAFRAAYQQLLNAEGRYYIIAVVSLLTTVLTYTAKIISVVIFDNIIVMQVLGVGIMLIQVAIYATYFHKKYKWINRSAKCDMSLLKNRKYYLIQQISGLIFNSTDTFVLSVFCGLKVASVYTVYNMVYSALSTLIGILRNSTNFVLGQAYHSDRKNFGSVYTAYSAMQLTLGNVLASTSILVITGFITLYTDGIEDINYINYLAAVLFSVNIMLDCARGASLAGANVAGKAPTTTWRYVLEAGLNLGISLLLVHSLQMVGVLLGTVLSGVWRSLDSICYFNINVLNRKPWKEILFNVLSFCIFGLFVGLGRFVYMPMNNYLHFILWGSLCVVGVSLVFGGLSILFYQAEYKKFAQTIKKN